jgi:SAM-dependent methyltransferase
MLSRLGAREVISVEGRVENFVKCCCIKDFFELHNVHFVLADVNDVTLEGYGTFDIIVAIGILYHLSDPARVLRNLSRMTTRLFIWTHCSDESYPDGPVRTLYPDGSSYQGKTYVEGGPREPLSGLEPFSFWPFEQELHRMIEDAGFVLKILDKGSAGEHGAKCCTIIATRE